MAVMTCGDPEADQHRTNPSTGDELLLCALHAELHDLGHVFNVKPLTST